MPEKGFLTVTFKQSVLKTVNDERQKEKKDVDLAPFLYELIDEALTQRKLIREWAPLQFINAEGSSVYIKDRVKGSMVELVVKDGDLFCTEDHSKDCSHIGFAWAIPAVYDVMRARGRKPPKS
jgi:hypothetical protein